MSQSKAFSRVRSLEFISLPVLRALFLQALTLVLVFLLLYGGWHLIGLQLTLPAAAILQGVVAALLSRRCLPAWWLIIQVLMPPAIIATQRLELPPWIFLLAFISLLALYWTTFRSRVPYYPSGRSAWETVAALLPHRPLRVIDVGSGFGGLAFYLAKQRPDSQIGGIEIAPLPWVVSAIRAAGRCLRGETAPQFLRGDYRKLHFGDYDVIFAYLSPTAMSSLWKQASMQMRPGTLLISYEFNIAGHTPDVIATTRCGRHLYGWRM